MIKEKKQVNSLFAVHIAIAAIALCL